MLIKNLFRYWTYQVFSPGTVLREKYEAFKRLLTHDRKAHEYLAVLEDLYYNSRRVDFEFLVKTYSAYSKSVSAMVEALLEMCPSGYWNLKAYHKKFDFYVRFMLAPPEFDFSPPFVLEFGQSELLDEALAGGKAATLDRISQDLYLPVPDGFVITTRAFHYFLETAGLRPLINRYLADLDIDDPSSLALTSRDIKAAIMDTPLPEELMEELNHILSRFCRLDPDGNRPKTSTRLSIRSSAVGEDGRSSFAGQYLSLMNVDRSQVAHGIKQIFASKYSEAAMAYRIRCGIPDHDAPMAVLVLEMLDAEAAGVVYTRDDENPDSGNVLIHSAWGLGGLLVDGRVTPDVVRVDPGGRIRERETGTKALQLVLDPEQGTRTIPTQEDLRRSISLDDPDILTLHRWAGELEEYFNTPQDMEWCRTREGLLFLLQSRSLQPMDEKKDGPVPSDPFSGLSPLCSGGHPVCSGRSSGPVFRLNTLSQLDEIPENTVVAARFGLPQFVTAIHKMAGVILENGSTAGHFASIAREFGIPAMICADGFDRLETGKIVTLDADSGRVLEGHLPESIAKREIHPADDGFAGSIFMDKLRFVIRFCADLKLTDPESGKFGPDHCRSLHDILRFTHETAVREMFFLGGRKGARKKGARQLVSGLPMLFYVLDVGGKEERGIKPVEKNALGVEDLSSVPMKALFKGLSHPGICWDETTHFDWDAYDKIVMAGGIISPESPQFGSYAVVSRSYMNVNLRFGYHFVILDSMCTGDGPQNYILFRFSGGGGNPEGRWLRAGFISSVLERIGFVTQMTSDLIDARLMAADKTRTQRALELTGRLLGATKLMDMYLKESADIGAHVEEFMNGRYDFRSFMEETP